MERPSASEVAALHEALEDEYRAWSTYDRVIADLGEASPFTNMRDAEALQIEALATVFARRGLPLPPNPWPGRVDRYPSLQLACQAGVAAEITNAATYERLLAEVHDAEVAAVLRRLQQASQQRHLPAFRRSAEGATGHCDGGRRRRQRGGRAASH